MPCILQIYILSADKLFLTQSVLVHFSTPYNVVGIGIPLKLSEKYIL